MSNIVLQLHQHAAHLTEQNAATFLAEDLSHQHDFTFFELHEKACQIAGFLQEKKLLGERVLLLYPPGLDFIIAFLGCLYAGAVVVPLYCPKLSEFKKSQDFILSIAQDADIAAIFTGTEYLSTVEMSFSHFGKQILIQDVRDLLLNPRPYQAVKIKSHALAYLQYTSGSTSLPKAAMINHAHLTHSLKYTAKSWGYGKNSVTLNWAPPTHVYGLICGILVPLFHGTPAILLSPTAFIQKPSRWLKAITQHQATHSGCPNFGYDLCVKEIKETELSEFNLKSWQVAVNGGENVQAQTLSKFSEKFASCGFHLKQFCSAYGMSEVTGAIAVSAIDEVPVIVNLDKEALENNQVTLKPEVPHQSFVTSGRLLPGLQVEIVDPQALLPVKKNQIGEVWLTGKSVASGYWRREAETTALFKAVLPQHKAVFFRTGDLGFLLNGELCLTGRLKELMVIHGKKYYPLDLEKTIATALSNFSGLGAVVFFSLPIQAQEEIICLQELDENHPAQAVILQTIRQVILEQYGIALFAVIGVQRHTIPKTASGKLQRQLCKTQYLENTLKRLKNPLEKSAALAQPTEPALLKLVASVLNITTDELHLSAPLSQYGFDSIKIIRLTTLINEHYQVAITPAQLFEYKTLADFFQDLLIQQTKSVAPPLPTPTKQDIAIIGMSALLPGANNLSLFWDNMLVGKDVIQEIPSERWDWRLYNGNRWGGFITNIGQFDASFFNMSPHEAALTDPQQRLFLQTVWHALEEAGYAAKTLAAIKTGLFVGVFNQDYAELLQANHITDAYITTGVTHSILANRISYFLNLQGPSAAIDTACSSSLVAIHQAVQAIHSGDCEIAIAGGVNALLTPTAFINASEAGMLSADGRCKTFDKKANGYVRSEGTAAILLKPLHKALADHDHIYGVIKGTAVNHGGHVNSLTAPNPHAQADVIVTACQRAEIAVEAIDYIETHGSGTPLGDPIEINGLKKAFKILAEQQNKPIPIHSCGLGSVKTHLGHLEPAAGIVGLIKVLLALQYEQLPGHAHFEELNPYIDLQQSPFYIIEKNQPWPKLKNKKRTAGISSFGYGGTNAHIIIEEAPAPRLNKVPARSTYLIALSAKTSSALQQRVVDLQAWLMQQSPAPSLAALSYTLNVGRDHFAHRCVFVVDTIAALIKNLQAFPATQTVNLQDQVLSRLAEQYLQGAELDWQSLYVDEKLERLALPGYPFSQEYFWFQASPVKQSSQLHPLLDVNASTLDKQYFTKFFTGKEFYFIDHQVQQKPVLAGSVFLEMARAGGQFAAPHRAMHTLKNIIWEHPLEGIRPVQTSLDLYPDGENILFKIASAEQMYVQGKIMSGLAGPTAELDITTISARCTQQSTGADIYAQFNHLGLHYGSSFQVITDVIYNNHEALATIKIPIHLEKTADAYVLHPSLLDGILQTAFSLLENKQDLHLPMSISELTWISSLQNSCYVYAKLLENSHPGLSRFELSAVDAQGHVLMHIKELALRRITPAKENIYYYKPQWQSIPVAKNQASQADFPILILAPDEDIQIILRRVYSPEMISWIKIDDAEQIDFDLLFNQLRHDGCFPKTIIYQNRERPLGQTLPAYQALFLSQALVKQKLTAPLQLLWVHQHAALFSTALAGFAKSLHLENPHIVPRVIELHSLDSILQVFNLPGIEIRLKPEAGEVKQYQEILLPPRSGGLKKKSVYLITGGMGGLGSILAHYLAENYQAKLILIGRSPISQSKIQTLQSLGAEVLYLQADVAKREELIAALQQAKQLFGFINGIFHAAGCVRDAYLLKKTKADFSAVLAAKIPGTLHLDAITQAEPLDFFMLFSSLASIVGNSGQCDYAYANGFMDEFAVYRTDLQKRQQRFGKTIAINWPLWAGGGMQLDSFLQQNLKDMLGLATLPATKGLEIVEAALMQSDPQLLVLPGDKIKIEKALMNNWVQPQKNATISGTARNTNAQNKTEAFLKKILALESKLPPEKIHVQDAFEQYGIDSVMIIKLNRQLEAVFGPISKTLFFEYPNLQSLAAFFVENYGSDFIPGQAQPIAIPQSLPTRFISPPPSLTQKTQSHTQDIAIIGISGRYPQANNLTAFWENLQNGKNAITDIPAERWPQENNFSKDQTLRGGFIDGVDQFDPLFFNISPRDAELMDPQERLFLETTWQTVEDAGYTREQLAQQKVGVYVGVMYGQYQLFGVEQAQQNQAVATHSIFSSIANRVSYYFNLTGPSMALDTMCSSSLTAIHLACQSLRVGECQLAIAGGVNVTIHPHKYFLLSRGQYLSSEGLCRSFGEGGDGYVPSEGVGAVLLKPLAQALADQDHIYAIIKGSSLNHGGRTNGYTVPNPQAQTGVIAEALQNAQVQPTQISYIEAHGTGTALGDPIEVAGLSKVPGLQCAIGSVKSNIGHAESAAGIAAVTKVVLQMQHQTLVPSLHAEHLNSNIQWDNSSFHVQRELQEWPAPRIAGISSFGAGGSNAHLIIADAPLPSMNNHSSEPAYLITLSAKTTGSLQQKIIELADWLAKKGEKFHLADLSYTLNSCKTHFAKRCAFVTTSQHELLDQLQKYSQDKEIFQGAINLTGHEKIYDQAVFNKICRQLLLEAPEVYLDNLLALANFYVDGYHIDWNLLYAKNKPRKISLPTYPFAKERCWFSHSVSEQPTMLSAIQIEDYLIQQAAIALKIQPQALQITTNLSDYGMDSIHYVNLTQKINTTYGTTLTPAKFYTHNSIQKMSDYLKTIIKNPPALQPVSRTMSATPKKSMANEDIAIIGMSGLFPQSPDLNALWTHLVAGDDLITEIPSTRWDWRNYFGDTKQYHNKTNSKWGGLIHDFDQFDAGFFNISAREANLLDPQQRLFLEIAWKTIEDAGYNPLSFAEKNIGVFVGVEFSEYQTLIAQQQKEFHGLIATGNSHSLIANRVSYFLNLRGPSEAVDTACSSSLVAIHRALQALRTGECTQAIAGGVSLLLNPDTFIITSQLGALSADGRCKPFDKSANGYVKGEGVGALLLKPLTEAQLAGDHIYGIIKGSAVNHGGKASSLTAPNALAQTELLVAAYQQANIDPATVSYIEAHGTGTALGDPIEVEGLKEAFSMLMKKQQTAFCGLGSVKSYLGHLEPASGIAGVIKVMLAMHHRILPGQLHFQALNPYIDLDNSPFYIVEKNQVWQAQKDEQDREMPRRAGVSSFGFGGTNAHIILEEVPIKQDHFMSLPHYLITLSAKEAPSLQQKITNLCQWLQKHKDSVHLGNLSYTLNAGHAHFEVRYACVVSTVEELLNTLTNRTQATQQKLNEFSLDAEYEAALQALQQSPALPPTLYRAQLQTLAALYLQKYAINWQSLYAQTKNRRQPLLPTYPFLKQRYWFDTEFKTVMTEKAKPDTTLLPRLQNIFADVLRVPPHKITYQDTYEVFGVDSVLGLEITQRLENEFGSVPKTILFERNNLNDLAGFLQKQTVHKIENTPTIKDNSTDIAIIGLSGTFPLAEDMQTFWDNLTAGRDCITEVPTERWHYQDYPYTVGGKEYYYNYGGFIPDVDKFDPLFFNISPRDAALMDPQERLFLQSAWTTLEDAGYTREYLQQVSGQAVGVFVGVTYNFYPLFMAEEWHKGNRVPLDSQMFSIANRVSYFLNVHGPSLVIDTACSSSLAAIHLACESIERGDCQLAIAGGVNLSLHPSKYHFLGSFSFLSTTGRCTSFAEGGNGYVPAEGVGSILLKPLARAIKDRDRIYGVIKGSSMNHGGKTSGYTVPNPNAQADVVKKALTKANISPDTISYIEAHGTGTSLGDPIEIRGLQTAFGDVTNEKQFCAIGSVKSNIGHCESAAGISQLAKVLLQMQYNKLVPSLHAKKLNPLIDFAQTPFYVQQELTDWPLRQNYPRRAGISSFGAGGANVHLIVEQYSAQIQSEPNKPQAFIFILSAQNHERLSIYAAKMQTFLKNQTLSLTNICYTLQIGRESMPARLAILAATYQDLMTKLTAYITQPQHLAPQTFVNENLDLPPPHPEKIQDMLQNMQIENLVQAWVQGGKIAWEFLYSNDLPQRISLPTYPFTKRRCWVPTLDTAPSPQPLLEIPDFLHDWLYDTTWEAKQPVRATQNTSAQHWLIFCDPEMQAALQNELGKENCTFCRFDEPNIVSALSTKITGILYAHTPTRPELASSSNYIDWSTRFLALFQSLISSKNESKLLFCLATCGSQPVLTTDKIQISQHPLWSLTRIFAAEQAQYEALLIDLSAETSVTEAAKQISDEMHGFRAGENHIAYRNQQRYTQRLTPYLSNHKLDKLPVWQAPKTVLITGGLGALGFEVAHWLVKHGTQFLLLTGTTDLPASHLIATTQDAALKEKMANLAILENAGAKIKYAAVNICDTLAMQALVEETEATWRTPITGVFHLAGITTDNLTIANMDQTTLQKVLSVKIQGALVLHELFKKTSLNCFVLFSSVAAIPYFGMSGLSAYAMANEFLNGLALARRREGYPALSINWVAWADKGMSFRYHHSEFLEAMGMSTLAITQGIDILHYLLALQPETVIVLKIVWQKFLQMNPEIKKLDFFAQFIKPELNSKKLDKQYTLPQIVALLREQLALFLSLHAEEITDSTPFQQYGMDSIIGINFVSALNNDFPDIVSPMDLYRYPTLQQLANFIHEAINIPEDHFPEISTLSDSEISQLIEEELLAFDLQ